MPPDIADLRQILDIDAVIGQFGADRLEVFALRAERVGEAGEACAPSTPRARPCATARLGVAAFERLVERGERRLGVGDDAERRPLRCG